MFGAQRCRFLSILQETQANLIPILSLAPGIPDPFKIPAVYASVALLVAAALVGLDRFFGFSSGWMRYMLTQQQIGESLRAFVIDWEADRLSWPDGQPDSAAIARMLARTRTFSQDLDHLVREETRAWMTEFSDALRQIDASAHATAAARAAAAPRRGGAGVRPRELPSPDTNGHSGRDDSEGREEQR